MKRILSLVMTLVMVLSLVAFGPSATASAADDFTFESFVPIDNADCKVTAKSLDPENTWGFTVKVALENKSSDKHYMFAVDYATVNGVEIDPFFAADVVAGKKANKDISFSKEALKTAGIDKITDIEFFFRVSDYDDWMADPVAEESFHVYPYGEEKAEKTVRKPAASDVVLADTDDITVTIISEEHDDIWGYGLNLYLENKTDKDLMFGINEASVNGYMIDPFWATEVHAGNSKYATVNWSDSSFEENDIEAVEEIEFTLKANDNDDWLADPVFEEVVTYTP